MSNSRQVDRELGFLLPPSVDEWLLERLLAHFVAEVIEQLDLSATVDGKGLSQLGLGREDGCPCVSMRRTGASLS